MKTSLSRIVLIPLLVLGSVGAKAEEGPVQLPPTPPLIAKHEVHPTTAEQHQSIFEIHALKVGEEILFVNQASQMDYAVKNKLLECIRRTRFKDEVDSFAYVYKKHDGTEYLIFQLDRSRNPDKVGAYTTENIHCVF
jgi:hypothetical protein